MATYFTVDYDNEATGPFVAEGANLTWTASVGFIVKVIDNGTTGTLKVALVSGNIPADNDVLTQGSTTADAFGAGRSMLYPAYFREDVAVASSGAITWTGPALGATHSFFFDGQTANIVAGEILTFSGGQTAECITVESDAGTTGELSVRFISDLDSGLPADNDTFTGDIIGDGVVNGVVHPRSYTPLNLHRLLADLNDDETINGNDDLSRVDPTPSGRDTDEIVNLLGTVAITDTVASHMFGGSVSQANGATLYSGLDVQLTSPLDSTQPVVIQDDAIVTDYWKNAYSPDSIAGNVRIMVKTRVDGVDIDGKRVRGALLEYGQAYFFGGTTLGTASTALALFSANDGNNNTAVGTVAGAPYNTVAVAEGYGTEDYSNGNGLTPFAMSIDFTSANSLQTYEWTKYIQRRGTSETLYSRNAQLFVGVNTNWAYDNESGNFTPAEILAWGTSFNYTGQTTNLAVGEVVTFSPSGAKGRVLYDNDAGATGQLVVGVEGNAQPTAADTITGVTSGGDGTVGTVVASTVWGTALLTALNDVGTTGNMYTQLLTGLEPVDNTIIWGTTSNQSAEVAGAVSSRTVNNQFVGVYTGTNFQTNFGITIDSTDAILGDQLRNLLDVVQGPPDNRQGAVSGLKNGDTVTVYPWDGAATDVNGDPLPTFGEMTLATALVSGVTTSVDVGTGNIPNNTPAAGKLRIEQDSDSNVILVQYSSHNGDDTFTLVGTSPITAAISNTVMRALIDEQRTSDGTSNYSAVFVTPEDVAITVKNGGALNGPIKTFKTNASFGAFSVGAVRTPD